MEFKNKFNTCDEIKEVLSKRSSGPNIFYDKGVPYTDDSEAHTACIGMTGMGKSECVATSHLLNIIRERESGVVVDAKDGYLDKVSPFIPDEYMVYYLDFSNPINSPTKFNPLRMPYELYKSKNPRDRDDSSQLINEMYKAVFPHVSREDQFWNEAAITFAKGITYAMFELCKMDEINICNVSDIMEGAEERDGANIKIRKFYQGLNENSLFKKDLSTYVTAPIETRGSIHATSMCGMDMFNKSEGLKSMLSSDNLDILNLDLDKPFLIFIVLPDESDEYHKMAGILISQLSLHFIRETRKTGMKLKRRVNYILEELGSIRVPNLAFLMAAGRSRNIRMLLIFQSYSQLYEMYGSNNGETIMSCIGTTIAFRSNNLKTLETWSDMLGDIRYHVNGNLHFEKIMYPNELSNMGVGQALIIVNGKLRYVTRLPMFHELYGNLNKKRINFNHGNNLDSKKEITWDDLIRRVNKEYTLDFGERSSIDLMMEKEFRREDERGYKVVVTSILPFSKDEGTMNAIKQEIMDITKKSEEEVSKLLKKLPFDIKVGSRLDAEVYRKIFKDLGVVTLIEREDC